MSNFKTVSIIDRLYTVKPYEGSRLMIRVEDTYHVSGLDCEIVGEIVRDERLPESQQGSCNEKGEAE